MRVRECKIEKECKGGGERKSESERETYIKRQGDKISFVQEYCSKLRILPNST